METSKQSIFGKLLGRFKKEAPQGEKERRQFLYKKAKTHRRYSVEEKLKLVKEMEESGAPTKVFAEWSGISVGSLEAWQKAYQEQGEAGLKNKTRGLKAQLSEDVISRIIQLKKENPLMGSTQITDWLARHDFVKVSKSSVLYLLKQNPETRNLVGKGVKAKTQREFEPHRFERSRPRQMYQMDITYWRLKGQHMVYIIGCIDDYSRYMVSWGAFRGQTSPYCIEVLKAAIEQHDCVPEEVLTDNGRQFYTWRGKNRFQIYLQKMGIKHIKSRPYHPQTLGKIESFWRNMYKEFGSRQTITSFEDLQEKLKDWINYYNFKRPHQGIDGLVPADRFYGIEKQMKETMQEGAVMVKEAKAAEPDKQKKTMYLVGRIGGQEIRVMAKDGNMVVQGVEKDGRQIPSGDTAGGETAGHTGGMEQGADGDRCVPESANKPADVLRLGECGETADADSCRASTERPQSEGFEGTGGDAPRNSAPQTGEQADKTGETPIEDKGKDAGNGPESGRDIDK
ncbi:MAG: IS481 family transposase [Nitrospirota bacterium]